MPRSRASGPSHKEATWSAGPIGLLAGWGEFPLEVARSLKSQGHPLICIGLRGHADPELQKICDIFRWAGIARIGSQIRFFRRHGVQEAIMAGKVFKARLMYHRFGWLHLVPDLRCLRAFYPYFISGTRDRKDDTLLKAVVDEYAKDNIAFRPASEMVPALLLDEGHWSGPPLSESQAKDVAFGWEIAKTLGRLDIGQSVAVKSQSCLAVEAVEGTDACIHRAGELCSQGGFVIIKVAKPQQDMRFDVPTIGVGTLESMRAAGATLLVVEAEKTIIVDRDRVFKLARQWGISILAIRKGQAFGLNSPAKESA